MLRSAAVMGLFMAVGFVVTAENLRARINSNHGRQDITDCCMSSARAAYCFTAENQKNRERRPTYTAHRSRRKCF